MLIRSGILPLCQVPLINGNHLVCPCDFFDKNLYSSKLSLMVLVNNKWELLAHIFIYYMHYLVVNYCLNLQVKLNTIYLLGARSGLMVNGTDFGSLRTRFDSRCWQPFLIRYWHTILPSHALEKRD